MSEQPPSVQQAIDYLCRIDSTEHWRADIEWTPSPEDWGMICLSKLAELENPTLEVIGTLLFAALTDEEEHIRAASAEKLIKFDPRLATIVFYLHTLDPDSWVVESALDYLCNDPNGNRKLGQLACERLGQHTDKLLRELASNYDHDIADNV